MKSMKDLQYTIVQEEGIRLENWLLYHWPALPYGEALKALRKGFVRVDGHKVKHGHRLCRGNQVTIDSRWFHAVTQTLPNHSKSSHLSQGEGKLSSPWLNRLQSWILYEDDDLIVLNKPRGMACQGGTKQLTSLDVLLGQRQQTLGLKGKIHLLHRLDRDTTGVLLVGKNLFTARYVGQLLATSSVKKTYWGVVAGLPAVPTGSIHVPLRAMESKGRGKMAACSPGTKGFATLEQPNATHKKSPPQTASQHALTHYRVVHTQKIEGQQYSLLCLVPETGRTHQIRVHLAHKGWPLVGDVLYGYPMQTPCTTGYTAEPMAPQTKRTLQLHCGSMMFPRGPLGCKGSDFDENSLLFSAPPPTDFMMATFFSNDAL